jgi:hypothetical protein
MSTNFDNRRRAFADVVSIDAWHDSFDGKNASVDLHADVVFGTARVGGESSSPIRFRLSIKRAEIVVVIPPSEPVTVNQSSVSRDSADLPAKLTEVTEHSAEAHAKGSVDGSIGPSEISASVGAEARANASISAKTKYAISAVVEFMLVTQSKTADGHYRWMVEPRRTRVLEGRPWNAVKKPRLTLVDKRKDRTRGIPPTVRVEVRCRREDLVIQDLVVKDEGLWESIKSRSGFAN